MPGDGRARIRMATNEEESLRTSRALDRIDRNIFRLS